MQSLILTMATHLVHGKLALALIEHTLVEPQAQQRSGGEMRATPPAAARAAGGRTLRWSRCRGCA